MTGPGAGQANTALRSVNARIAQMRPGNRTLSLRLPEPGGTEALKRLALRLQATGAFESLTLPPAAPNPPEPAPQAAPDAEPDFDDHRDV